MAEQIARSRCRPARRPVGGEGTASGRDKEKKKEVLFYCRQKATFGSERAALRTKFGSFFGAELDCGKLWRRRSLGAGVYQPEGPWEVRECFRLHFEAFLEVERFQNRLLGKSPKKSLNCMGTRRFAGTSERVKKNVKMCTKSTKDRRSGKAQNVGGFGTVFECFCCARQGPKECKLQCFCKL